MAVKSHLKLNVKKFSELMFLAIFIMALHNPFPFDIITSVLVGLALILALIFATVNRIVEVYPDNIMGFKTPPVDGAPPKMEEKQIEFLKSTLNKAQSSEEESPKEEEPIQEEKEQ